MANLQGTTVTGNLSVTGATSGQGAVPIGAVVPIVSALSGSHTIPSTGVVDADGWQLCDGANVPVSQTLSGATPDLTDGRFLRGFTSSSGCGGAATFTLGLANLAAHDHGTNTGACGATTGNYSADHTHSFTTGAQNCQHCHCVCDSGTHSHTVSSWRNCCSAGGTHQGSQLCCALDRGTDGRLHCSTHTCCTYNALAHSHSGNSGGASANHSHSIPSHTHTVASAGSASAVTHIPIYFNVKYLIRVI
jgi:hypothetical protein